MLKNQACEIIVGIPYNSATPGVLEEDKGSEPLFCHPVILQILTNPAPATTPRRIAALAWFVLKLPF
ncbi:MAG: hypothetical protein KGJ88_03580 [Verrucomicrobiota bacterium]|nr:hypothetical protein [Verrucomicrobiota bacterium]